MLEAIGVALSAGLIVWLVILVAFAATVAISEYERVEILGYAFLAGALGLFFWNGTNVFALLWHNLSTVVTWTVVWLFIGTVWSFWKWDRHCAKARVAWQEAYEKYSGKDLAGRWQDAIPRAMKSTRKFLTWIILWPQSMFWYVFSDLIHDLVDVILWQLAGVYDAIARRHFKDLEAAPPVAPKTAAPAARGKP